VKFDLRIWAGLSISRVIQAVASWRHFGKSAFRRGRFFYFKHRSRSLPRASGALFEQFQPGAKPFNRIENLFGDFYPRWTIATLALCAEGTNYDTAGFGHLTF
jgi:hypothetical protein